MKGGGALHQTDRHPDALKKGRHLKSSLYSVIIHHGVDGQVLKGGGALHQADSPDAL